MTKLPAPPSPEELRDRAPLVLHNLDTTTLLWRVHETVGHHVLGWNELRRYGPAAGRFDPQPPPPVEDPSLGVLYLAAGRVDVALAEAFQRTRRVDIRAGGPWLTALRLSRPVRLLDLAGHWPTRAGASQELCSGPRPRAQAWARAISHAWPELEGLWYPASMLGGGRCLALWAPDAGALPRSPELSLPLNHPGLWGALAVVCEQIGYRLG